MSGGLVAGVGPAVMRRGPSPRRMCGSRPVRKRRVRASGRTTQRGACAMRQIRFQRHGAGHATFSPASPHPVHIDGCDWPTVEHFVQAHRFAAHDPRRQQIHDATLGSDVQRIVVRGQADTRSDWIAVRDGLMYRGLMAKFQQHEALRAELLATGSSLLALRRHGDHYWGDGGDGTGQNMIGRTLMAIREELRRGADLAVASG